MFTEDMLPDHSEATARSLRRLLCPSNLLQEVRAYVFSEPGSALDIADSEQTELEGDVTTAFNHVFEVARELGRKNRRGIRIH